MSLESDGPAGRATAVLLLASVVFAVVAAPVGAAAVTDTEADAMIVSAGQSSGPSFQTDDGAGITYTPREPVVGEPVQFVAFVDVDGDADYRWHVEGATLRGPSVGHTFQEAGVVTVVLDIRVGGETVRRLETTVEVGASSSPAGDSTVGFRQVPPTVEAGLPTTFVATGDVGGEGAPPRWDFDGDGTPDERGRVVSHTFDGTDPARVTLTTPDSRTVTRTFSVEPNLRDLPETLDTSTLDCRATSVCELPGARPLLGSERVVVEVTRDPVPPSFLAAVRERTGAEELSQPAAPTVTYFAHVEDGRVTELTVVDDPASRDPTMRVLTDESTVRRIHDAEDPGAALATAYDDGRVSVRGVGLVNGIKVGLVTALKGIYDAFSGLADTLADLV